MNWEGILRTEVGDRDGTFPTVHGRDVRATRRKGILWWTAGGNDRFRGNGGGGIVQAHYVEDPTTRKTSEVSINGVMNLLSLEQGKGSPKASTAATCANRRAFR